MMECRNWRQRNRSLYVCFVSCCNETCTQNKHSGTG